MTWINLFIFPSLRLMPPTPKALGFEILRFEVWEFRIQDLRCKIQDLRFLSFVRLESWELRCRGFELWESKNKLTWQVSCTPYRMWSVLLLEPRFIDLCLTQCPVPPVLLFSSLQDSCPVPWFCSFQMLLPARLPSPFPPPFPPLSPLPDLALRGFR